jgi:hypothetical protein
LLLEVVGFDGVLLFFCGWWLESKRVNDENQSKGQAYVIEYKRYRNAFFRNLFHLGINNIRHRYQFHVIYVRHTMHAIFPKTNLCLTSPYGEGSTFNCLRHPNTFWSICQRLRLFQDSLHAFLYMKMHWDRLTLNTSGQM